MNKEEPYRDQAERLKRRIQKINEKVEGNSEKLPPREQVHRNKKKKTKWKVKYPVIRLLVLCFILLPIIIFSVISYRENGLKINGPQKTSGTSVGYETIKIKETQAENEDQEVETSKPQKEDADKPADSEQKDN